MIKLKCLASANPHLAASNLILLGTWVSTEYIFWKNLVFRSFQIFQDTDMMMDPMAFRLVPWTLTTECHQSLNDTKFARGEVKVGSMPNNAIIAFQTLMKYQHWNMTCVRSTVSYYKVGKSHNLAIIVITNGRLPILQDYSSRKPTLARSPITPYHRLHNLLVRLWVLLHVAHCGVR
jgi:hypothetical protein